MSQEESHYVVFEDGETWTSEYSAFIVPSRFISSEMAAAIADNETKVFKNKTPRISVEMLIDTLERAGLWDTIVDELIEEEREEE